MVLFLVITVKLFTYNAKNETFTDCQCHSLTTKDSLSDGSRNF